MYGQGQNECVLKNCCTVLYAQVEKWMDQKDACLLFFVGLGGLTKVCRFLFC